MNNENIDNFSYKIVFSDDIPYILIFGVKVDLRVELPKYNEMIAKKFHAITIMIIQLWW